MNYTTEKIAENDASKELLLEKVNAELSSLIQEIKFKNEGEYVVNLFGNDAISIRRDNGFKPLDSETRRKLQSQSQRSSNLIAKNPEAKMTKNNYDRLLREKREFFLHLDLQDKICVMLTLNSNPKENITYNAITKAVKAFSKRLRRTFDSSLSIKRYEHGEKARMLHVHYLLFFDVLPKSLSEDWIRKT